MSFEAQKEETRQFFDRPGQLVAASLSTRWMVHPDRKTINQEEGYEGQIVGLQTRAGVKYYKVEQVVLYPDEYTQTRWLRSRAPEISALESGEGIGYYSQGGHILTFLKTQNAENIQLDTLREVDRRGDPLPGDEMVLSSSKIAPAIGLRHKEHAQVAPFDFRDRRAFLISAGVHIPTDEELRRIEEDLLS